MELALDLGKPGLVTEFDLVILLGPLRPATDRDLDNPAWVWDNAAIPSSDIGSTARSNADGEYICPSETNISKLASFDSSCGMTSSR